jgi:hypothetical protein
MRAIECDTHREVFSSVVRIVRVYEQSKGTASKNNVAGLMISCYVWFAA